jgi:hypothetical protein
MHSGNLAPSEVRGNHRPQRFNVLPAPLQSSNRPSDAFERRAHTLALTGQPHTAVQRVDDQWYYRRSIPLSNFRAECALCHANFPPGPTSDWMGALMLRVPIE